MDTGSLWGAGLNSESIIKSDSFYCAKFLYASVSIGLLRVLIPQGADDVTLL